MRLILTGGNIADISQAPALIESFSPQAAVADKGYDSDAFVETIANAGAEPVIPPRSNRTSPREFDRHRYKARNLVERFFNRLKPFRRIATRYDKLAQRFNPFLHLAGVPTSSYCEHALRKRRFIHFSKFKAL